MICVWDDMNVESDEAPELLGSAFRALVTGHQTIVKGGQGLDAANNVQVCSATSVFSCSISVCVALASYV